MNALAETIRAALAAEDSAFLARRDTANGADRFRTNPVRNGMETLAWEIAATLERSNPRFDRGKFASAAGLTV